MLGSTQMNITNTEQCGNLVSVQMLLLQSLKKQTWNETHLCVQGYSSSLAWFWLNFPWTLIQWKKQITTQISEEYQQMPLSADFYAKDKWFTSEIYISPID